MNQTGHRSVQVLRHIRNGSLLREDIAGTLGL
jgi:hypothetical protein